MKVVKLPKEINSEELVDIRLNISTNVRRARLSVGLTQTELAEILGYESGTAISLIESGDRTVSTTTLWKIAQITDNPIQNFYFKGLLT